MARACTCTRSSINYSRRILGWCVEERLNPLATLEILSAAGANNWSAAEPGKESAQPSSDEAGIHVVMDSGIENLNTIVDSVFDSGQLRRVLAQVDVTFSNSLIEAWWRSLKHQWLYLHQLDSIATVRSLVGFYVQQHNEVMPHSAFNGLTPDEVYFGKTDGVVESLADRRSVARHDRIAINRQSSCPECSRAPPHKTGRRAA